MEKLNLKAGPLGIPVVKLQQEEVLTEAGPGGEQVTIDIPRELLRADGTMMDIDEHPKAKDHIIKELMKRMEARHIAKMKKSIKEGAMNAS